MLVVIPVIYKAVNHNIFCHVKTKNINDCSNRMNLSGCGSADKKSYMKQLFEHPQITRSDTEVLENGLFEVLGRGYSILNHFFY